jgi:hypothetical protein
MLQTTLIITITPIAALFAVHTFHLLQDGWRHKHGGHHRHRPI